MISDIVLFDCTVRESGYQTGWFFDADFVRNYYCFLNQVGVDYMELGFFHQESKDPGKGPYRYSSERQEYIASVIDNIKSKTKISSMLDLQRPMAKVLYKVESSIDAIRVINRSHENDFRVLESKVLELDKKGYEVSINFTSSGVNTDLQNREFLAFVKQMPIASVYFADTESVFDKNYIERLTNTCSQLGVKNYGLHLHDKKLKASQLMEYAYELGCRRFDSTLLGFGGKWHDWNLTTEFVLSKFDIGLDPKILNNLKRDLVQQIVKYKAFDTTIYE